MPDPTSAEEKTTSQMAPEQGQPHSLSRRNSASTASGVVGSPNHLQPIDTQYDLQTTGWIYTLRKEELINVCNKFNIEVDGCKVADLRKLLSAKIKNQRLSKSTENLLESIKDEALREENDIIVIPSSPIRTSVPTTHTQTAPTAITQASSINRDSMATSSANITYNNHLRDPTVLTQRLFEENSLAKQARAWNIVYQGGNDLFMFLNRLERNAENLGLDFNALIPTLPYVLDGSALRWYEVQGRNIYTWEEFRSRITNFFLPSRYLSQIENNYYHRKQKSGETARDFILDLVSLAQTHPDLKYRNHLDRAYDNLLPDYRLKICRDTIHNIEQLTSRCNEYEQLQLELNKQSRQTESRTNDNRGFRSNRNYNSNNNRSFRHERSNNSYSQPPQNNYSQPPQNNYAPPAQANNLQLNSATIHTEPPVNNNSTTVVAQNKSATNHGLDLQNYRTWKSCWRCKETGHTRFNCTNQPKLFCSRCGRDNIQSKDCPCAHSNIENYLNNRLYVTVSIKNRLFTALIDTGASQTYMSDSLISFLLRNKVKLLSVNQTVQVANQVMVPCKYNVNLPIVWNNRTTTIRTILMPDLAGDIILGIDFLIKRNCKIMLDNIDIPFSPAISTNYPSLNLIKSHQDISVEQQKELDSFVDNQKTRFNTIQGPCKIGVHSIKMKHEQPIKQRYYAKNPAMQQVINDEIDSLLADNRIEPSKSPYSSPIVLVRKKQGTWRMCIDYRQINAASEPDAYPLPQIQAILDQLKEAIIISSIDLKNGYWQIPLEEKTKPYTAFTVPGRGLFQWRVMPFGLHSAPATFQRTLDSIIGPELHPQVFAYLDDIIITGKTFEEHMENLAIVCNKLYDANMQINFEKSEFAKTKVHYLGHVVSKEGIHTAPEKIEAIEKLAPPTSIKELRRILGIASWYRRFVPNFSAIVSPLTLLLKKNQKWQWEEKQENAFKEIKSKLTTAPVLRCPDFSLPFFLQTDASNQGLGVVLFQRKSDQERVIAYASRTLSSAEKNYSTTEQECLAILWGIRKMRAYLEGYKFTVITDHHSLKWLHKLQNPSGRLARWALEIQQYNFNIEYRKGSSNVVADALSRSPLPPTVFSLTIASDNDSNDWVTNKVMLLRQNPEKFPDFQIINDRLFKHIPRKNAFSPDPEWKLCISNTQKINVLNEVHNSPTAGHLGLFKTVKRAQSNYYWPGMYRDILNYVKTCTLCNRFKPSQQKSAGYMSTLQCSQPWEVICADFIGPLPRSSNSNIYLLVFVDKFSKWIELVPLRQATATSVAKALRERIIFHYGCPKIFLTDNGRQFTSREIQTLMAKYSITHMFTAPYSPQENPTERSNRIIKTMIAQLCDGNHRKWDEYLPEISFAINTAISETTQTSAAHLMFGRNLIPPSFIRNEDSVPTEINNQPSFSRLWAKTVKIAQEASNTQQSYYNRHKRHWDVNIGDLVFKREHFLSSAANHFAQKLAPKYAGPFQVNKKLASNIYELINNETQATYQVHIKDIKPYLQSTKMEQNHKRTNPLPPGQVKAYCRALALRPPEKPAPYIKPPEAQIITRPQPPAHLAALRRITTRVTTTTATTVARAAKFKRPLKRTPTLTPITTTSDITPTPAEPSTPTTSAPKVKPPTILTEQTARKIMSQLKIRPRPDSKRYFLKRSGYRFLVRVEGDEVTLDWRGVIVTKKLSI